MKFTRIEVDEQLSFLVQTEDESYITEDVGAPTSPLPPGAIPTGSGWDAVLAMKRTMEAVVSYVRQGFLVATHPDELSVEFSISLKGASGIPVVASSSTEGTFKISAKWKKNE